MTMFERREKAHAAAFMHAQEARFKVTARSLRALALWAAERMNKPPQERVAYAERAVNDLTNPGGTEDAVLSRIAADMAAVGCDPGARTLAERMRELKGAESRLAP